MTADRDGPERGSAVLAEGLIAGTPIATPDGWRPVERIAEGDAVLTFDGPAQRVQLARHSRIAPSGWPPGLLPLRVPAGALENRRELVLLSGQMVLLESDSAETMTGDTCALVPASALVGYRGIARLTQSTEMLAVTLDFGTEQIVYASGATLVRCAGTAPVASGLAGLLRAAEAGRITLGEVQALHLVACLIAEQAGEALRLVRAQAARF